VGFSSDATVTEPPLVEFVV